MLRGYLSDAKSTVFDPAFYVRVRSGTLSRPIKLLALLSLLGSLVASTMLYSSIVSLASSSMWERISSIYPPELVITATNGELHVNQQEPYKVPNPFLYSDQHSPSYLVIFDTGDQLRGGARTNDTVALVKKTYALITQGKGEERSVMFADISTTSTTTITKVDVDTFLSQIHPYVKPVLLGGGLIVAFFFCLVSTGIWLLFHLLYLFVPALLVYMYGRFRIPQLKWRESYIVALYASVPVAAITFVISFFGFEWPAFFYTFLVFLVALVNVANIPNENPLVSRR